MTMMQSIQGATFCSYDENETNLRYVYTFKKWVVGDNRGLSLEFDRFQDAMINMSIITGVPFLNWTILGE